ncbi:hypothetical protein [Haloplanus natans]|uniref:hypothetical protein n=1 Tax=Haloplanus natans TaxID=376171 RepID=UPI0012F9BE4A|nr:hypothetical protein [Haloplanus natans]
MLERLSRVVPRGKGATLFEDLGEVALYPVGRSEITELTAVGSEAVIGGLLWSRNRGLVIDARSVARRAENYRPKFGLLTPTIGAGTIERGQSLGEWLGVSPLRPVGAK